MRGHHTRRRPRVLRVKRWRRSQKCTRWQKPHHPCRTQIVNGGKKCQGRQINRRRRRSERRLQSALSQTCTKRHQTKRTRRRSERRLQSALSQTCSKRHQRHPRWRKTKNRRLQQRTCRRHHHLQRRRQSYRHISSNSSSNYHQHHHHNNRKHHHHNNNRVLSLLNLPLSPTLS